MTIPQHRSDTNKRQSSRRVKARKSEWESAADYYDDDETPPVRVSYATADNTFNERNKDRLYMWLPEEVQFGVLVPRFVLTITKNPTDAIVLSQIIYWLKDSRGKSPRPQSGLNFTWTALTSEALSTQLRLSVDQIDKSLKSLKQSGFIDWKRKLFAGKQQRHIWVNWSIVAKHCDKYFSDDEDE